MERVRSPAGRIALRRAIRVAAVASVGFLLARFAFGNAQMAVFAAFSAIAMATIPDLRGSRRTWIAVHVVATLAAAPLVVLGTVVSGDTLLASVTMFAVVLGTLLVCAGGGYLATLGNVLVMVYVVAASVPAPAGTIWWRLLGLATTGVLAIVAILVLGPEPAAPRLRLAIAGVYRTLAELAGTVLNSASAGRVDDCRASVRDAVDAVYPAVGSIADHPPGSDRVERTEMHLLGRAFRIEAALTTLARVGRADPPFGPDLLPAVRDALAACGDALASGAGPPDVRPVHRAWTAAREAAASGSPPATVAEAAAARELLMAGQLTTGAAAEACVTLGVARAPGVAAALRDATEPATPGRRAAPLEWADRVRVQLTPRSQYLRNSFRLALGLSVARAIAGVLGLSHGFWVVFATLTVMRTTASRTGANLVQALAGTVAGAVVASALVLLVGREQLIYVFLLPVLFFLCMYLGAVWSLLVAQAAFTVTVVVLFNLITPAGWSLALTRVEDVAVGAAAGIAIGVLVWPRGAASQVRRSFRDLLVGAGRLVREGAVALEGGGSGTAAAARQLLSTIHACDDVLARRLAERDDHVGFDAWVRLLALSRMVWWAGQEVTDEALRDVPGGCE
ncbi:MAG TPA: FUSC family protein, partial [Candidatus Binatia bacterium]|nr:FUSC family protein [Candidatus Binatia bacterium]